MDERVKKVLLIAVVVVALAVAIFEGISFAKGPTLIKGKEFGHAAPGHGMKAAEKAEGSTGRTSSPQKGVDPLAGPG